jgi:hypothetical protein
VTAVRDLDGVPPNGTIGREIIVADEASAAHHFRHNEVCYPPAVESGRPTVPHGFQGCPQLGLPECRAGRRRTIVREKRRSRSREKNQARTVLANGRAAVLIDEEAFIGKPDRWGDNRGKGQTAMSAVCFRQSSDRSGYSSSQMASDTRLRVGRQVHVT